MWWKINFLKFLRKGIFFFDAYINSSLRNNLENVLRVVNPSICAWLGDSSGEIELAFVSNTRPGIREVLNKISKEEKMEIFIFHCYFISSSNTLIITSVLNTLKISSPYSANSLVASFFPFPGWSSSDKVISPPLWIKKIKSISNEYL